MPTIKDVAKECGVSANTVSSVLNNRAGEVSSETRERVLVAMRRMGYRPNASARRMAGKRLNTLGIADRYMDSTAESNSYKSAILEAILRAARGKRWDILYYSGHPSEEQVGPFPAYLDGRCDGLICYTGSIDRGEADIIAKTGLPVVLIGEPRFREEGVAVIDVDNEPGAYMAVRHLTNLGHTRIAMLCSMDTAGNEGRMAGYRRALSDGGISIDSIRETAVVPHGQGGYAGGIRLLAERADVRPTAVFCFNDGMAIGLLRAAAELGIPIPEQLSVVGFDDIPSSSTTSPPLTSVRQPLAQIGKRAVEILVGIVDRELPRNHREMAAPELIVRASTAPPYSDR